MSRHFYTKAKDKNGKVSNILVEIVEVHCPECDELVWDRPKGHKLAKCWNSQGHKSLAPLAFDTMDDKEGE